MVQRSARQPKAKAAAGSRRAPAPRHEYGTPLSLDPPLEFLSLIWQLDHSLQVASKRMASRLGVTGPQRLVLKLVAAHPGVSAGALAGVLHVHKSTVTGILQRLEARRLITREVDKADARRVNLTVTAAGRKMLGGGTATIEGTVRRAIEGHGPGAVAATRTILDSLAKDLAKLTKP